MKKLGALTEDVYNADVFQILMKYEIARSKRYPSPLTLIQMNVTPITINADSASSAPIIFSTALNAHLRAADIPARLGNLFAVLLPNADKHGAQAVCERLLSVFRNKFEDHSGNSVTFSMQIGAATHPGGDEITSEFLMEKAAEALKLSALKGPNTYVHLV